MKQEAKVNSMVEGSLFDKNDISFRYLSYFVLGCLLLFFCGLILKDANWTLMGWGDDYQLAQTTGIGKPSHSWTGNGRFWPLGLCDYSLLLLVPYNYGRSILAHFSYNCVTMIIASVTFFKLLNSMVDRESGDSWKSIKRFVPLFCMIILFASSSFLQIHMSCIYAEREMFFMLAFFLLFYWKALNEETESRSKTLRNYGIAFFTVVYLTYIKEPVFGLWIIFACSNLFFGRLSLKSNKINRKFNFAILVNCAIWLSIYIYRKMFRDKGDSAYASIVSNLSDIKFELFNNEPLIYVLIALALVRCYSIVLKKREYNAFCDSTLFAAIGYSFAYILLNIHYSYYVFPSIVLGIPTIASFLCKNIETNKISKIFMHKILIVCSVFLCMFYSIDKSVGFVNDIMEHRRNDPKIFTYLIDEYKAGKQILFVTNEYNAKISSKCRDKESMIIRRYEIFLDYYFGKQFPLIKTADYSKINENTIIICSQATIESENFAKISEQMKKYQIGLYRSVDEIESKVFCVRN